MKTLLFNIGLFTTVGLNAQNFQYLDINHVKAGINCSGTIHYDPNTGNSSYEVPKGSGRHSGGRTSLWIGGLDISNQLKLAGQTNPQTASDYSPGPLSVIDATTNSTVVSQYNKVWKINKSEIDAFLNGGSLTTNILNWPGNGDISQNQDLLLAPFVDVDNDGVYTPQNGDYPKIKGDQAIFYVYNDSYGLHASGGQAIGVEIRVMAYAYNTCSLVAANPYLDYTTFYNYQIINRSSFDLYSTYVSLETEADLGNYTDDFIGCDVQDAYGYTYNADVIDENGGGVLGYGNHPPAAGYQLLKSPYSDPLDGLDNDGDGMTDEPNEEIGLTGFYYYNNSFPGIPIQMTDPSNAVDYYHYMTGFWKDGTPFTCGGNAYGGSISTQYVYPSNTYTTGGCTGASSSWTEIAAGGDRRYIMSSGPFTLKPGSVIEVEFANVTSFDSITNNPLAKLDQDMHNLKLLYNSGTMNSCSVVSLKENNKSIEFELFPNPTNSLLTVLSDQFANSITNISISDVLGKVVLSTENKNAHQINLNVSELSDGVYFLKVTSEGKSSVKKFVKE